jgi:hypothetical protein
MKLSPVDPHLPWKEVARITGQNARVLELLREGPLTSTRAIELGITRLAARVHDLKSHGFRITAHRNGPIAEYHLEDR